MLPIFSLTRCSNSDVSYSLSEKKVSCEKNLSRKKKFSSENKFSGEKSYPVRKSYPARKSYLVIKVREVRIVKKVKKEWWLETFCLWRCSVYNFELNSIMSKSSIQKGNILYLSPFPFSKMTVKFLVKDEEDSRVGITHSWKTSFCLCANTKCRVLPLFWCSPADGHHLSWFRRALCWHKYSCWVSLYLYPPSLIKIIYQIPELN